jgi:hypothetical protein
VAWNTYISLRNKICSRGNKFKFVNCVLKENHKESVHFPQTSFTYSHVLIKCLQQEIQKNRLTFYSMQDATRPLILTIYCRHIKFPKSFFCQKCELERKGFTWISLPWLANPMRAPALQRCENY